ncbi:MULTISPECIES: hypothetical protein [Actinoplanes]|uniref:hypothetical protein n=1 Tax=Actinoplanes TaxID=1865 RepID=UPI0006973CAC|nr:MULTISPECIES: hypothetical protein [Actinoplanes]GLY05794.1 hypothetical protein Acsp01_61730 [Actinoplanes sp. NBRC 101535]
MTSHPGYPVSPDNADLTQPVSLAGLSNAVADLTQPVNIGDLTQAVHAGDLTQAVNAGDLTQAVNAGDLTQAVNAGDLTQAVNAGDLTQPVRISGMPSPAAYGNGEPPTQMVPQQRGQQSQQAHQLGGTVYGTGGYPSIDTTMPVSMDPVENSGSLTGHILAQGWYTAPVEERRSNVKVVVAMLVVLGLLVTVSLIFAFTAGDAVSEMVKNLTN